MLDASAAAVAAAAASRQPPPQAPRAHPRSLPSRCDVRAAGTRRATPRRQSTLSRAPTTISHTHRHTAPPPSPPCLTTKTTRRRGRTRSRRRGRGGAPLRPAWPSSWWRRRWARCAARPLRRWSTTASSRWAGGRAGWCRSVGRPFAVGHCCSALPLPLLHPHPINPPTPDPTPCIPGQYGELLHTSGLPVGPLRRSLLVLQQHNFVNAYLRQEPPRLNGRTDAYTLYEAALPRALQSLRCVCGCGRVGGRVGVPGGLSSSEGRRQGDAPPRCCHSGFSCLRCYCRRRHSAPHPLTAGPLAT